MLITWWKNHVTLRVGFSYGKPASCLVWPPPVFCKCRYNIFSLSRDFTKPPNWEVTQIYGWKFLAVCHHPEKFCDRRYRDNGNKMFLICHVTSRNHMFKGLMYVNLGVEAPIRVSYHFAMFGGSWSTASGNVKYYICHMTRKKQLIEGSCNMSGSSSYYVTTLASLVVIGIVVIELHFVYFVTFNQRAMWLYGLVSLMVSYHPATFGSHGHSGSGDMFLFWQLTSQDHVIKDSCDFIGWSPSW